MVGHDQSRSAHLRTSRWQSPTWSLGGHRPWLRAAVCASASTAAVYYTLVGVDGHDRSLSRLGPGHTQLLGIHRLRRPGLVSHTASILLMLPAGGEIVWWTSRVWVERSGSLSGFLLCRCPPGHCHLRSPTRLRARLAPLGGRGVGSTDAHFGFPRLAPPDACSRVCSEWASRE